MTSYNLSSVVAIAKKMIRKENSRVSICIISKFTNSLVYMASSKTAKSYIGTGLKIQKKKKTFSCEECIPYRKKHLAVVNKMDLYLCYKAHFYLDRKVLCGNIKLYSTIFSFCVGCLHAGQRTGISLGPVVQTHVVRLVVPTQSRMFVLQLQAVIM